MNRNRISIIVAMSKNRVIGNSNKLPWYIPEELKRFRDVTLDHPIIMGRKTHESIGRVLPNRTNIVITRDPEKIKQEPGLIAVDSLEKAIDEAKKSPGSEEIFIIGGGQIYIQALPIADKLYLTVIDKDYEGDVTFPDYSQFNKEVKRESRESQDGIKFTFLELEKN